MHAQLRFPKSDRFGLVLTSFFVAMIVTPVFAQAPAAGPTIEAAQAQAEPEMQMETTVHDFGQVWAGPRLNCTFTAKNVGEGTLVIKGVTPSDKSITAGLHARAIKPGRTGQIPFFLNTNLVNGQFNFSATVLSNDPKTPKLELTIKGEVRHRIDVSPPEANFGAVYGNEPKTQVIKITNHLDTPLELALDPFASTRKFRFKLTETEPGKAFTLEVTMVPPFDRFGPYTETAVIMTNQSIRRQLRIQASVDVKDRLDVDPAEITLGNPTPGNSGRDTVLTFTNFGDTQVKVIEATVNDDKLKVNVQKQTDQTYRIALNVPSDYVIPAEGRLITIKTDDDAKPMLQVPVKKKPVQKAPPPKKSKPRPAEQIVGQEAPDYALATADGQKISKDGKITVLNFYASQCGFCRRQMPRLEKLRPEYEAKGVRFVYVTRPWRGPPPTVEQQTQFMQQIGVKGMFALDVDGKIGSAFRVGGVPSMAIVGKTGKVEAATVGNRPDLEERVKAQLDALLADKAIPEEYLPATE